MTAARTMCSFHITCVNIETAKELVEKEDFYHSVVAALVISLPKLGDTNEEYFENYKILKTSLKSRRKFAQ